MWLHQVSSFLLHVPLPTFDLQDIILRIHTCKSQDVKLSIKNNDLSTVLTLLTDKVTDLYFTPNFISSSSLALQPNAGLRLHNGPLPNFPKLFWFPKSHFFMGWGCQPHAQSSNLEDPGTECPSYTPRHWVRILVAFYNMHGLQREYSLIPVTTWNTFHIRMNLLI